MKWVLGRRIAFARLLRWVEILIQLMHDIFGPSSSSLDTTLGSSHEILRSSQVVEEGIGVVKGEEFDILEILPRVDVIPRFTLFGLPVDDSIELMVLYFDSCLICCHHIDQIDRRTWSYKIVHTGSTTARTCTGLSQSTKLL